MPLDDSHYIQLNVMDCVMIRPDICTDVYLPNQVSHVATILTKRPNLVMAIITTMPSHLDNDCHH
jgi:hypothetical protein